MPGKVGGQLARFLLVGTVTVAVDFLAYRMLLALSVPVVPAKAASFVVATILAYFLNRLWTFRAEGGAGRALAFTALYAMTLLVNVAVNAAALRVLRDVPGSVELAFLAAQACSTTINFVAMRYVVFRPASGSSGGPPQWSTAAPPPRSAAPPQRPVRPTR